jgi:hypothetical protein
LSFAPVLIGLGVIVGVSIAAELAALLWSTLLMREEAPRLAAVSGLGAAFLAACQAALRFNVDAIRLRVRDLRIIMASFAIAALGFALVSTQAGFAASVAGFALIGVGAGPIVPCGFALSARQSAAGPAVGLASASLFSAVTRLPAPMATGAIAQALTLPIAFGALTLALAGAAAALGRHRLREPGAAQGIGRVLTWRDRNCRGRRTAPAIEAGFSRKLREINGIESLPAPRSRSEQALTPWGHA